MSFHWEPSLAEQLTGVPTVFPDDPDSRDGLSLHVPSLQHTATDRYNTASPASVTSTLDSNTAAASASCDGDAYGAHAVWAVTSARERTAREAAVADFAANQARVRAVADALDKGPFVLRGAFDDDKLEHDELGLEDQEERKEPGESGLERVSAADAAPKAPTSASQVSGERTDPEAHYTRIEAAHAAAAANIDMSPVTLPPRVPISLTLNQNRDDAGIISGIVQQAKCGKSGNNKGNAAKAPALKLRHPSFVSMLGDTRALTSPPAPALAPAPSAAASGAALPVPLAGRGRVLVITVMARAFLHSQVRILVGFLVAVAQRRIAAADVERILAAKDRRANPAKTAPPEGLFLAQVYYPPGEKEHSEWLRWK